MSAERRKSKRFNMNLAVEYRTLTQNPVQGTVVADNVSRGGFSFVEESDIQRGTTLQLSMKVPGDGLPVFATGMVTWADGSNIGVSLTKISKSDQEKILESIYQNWLKRQTKN
ncbi:MAG: hypothetical protein ACI9CF_000284 [Candidatus Omnitrophota bacterium]|jgi:hypothetical protein